MAVELALRAQLDAAADQLALAVARAPVLAQVEAAVAAALQAETARFGAGVATSADVLARQHELTEARWRVHASAIDAARARAELAALVGGG